MTTGASFYHLVLAKNGNAHYWPRSIINKEGLELARPRQEKRATELAHEEKAAEIAAEIKAKAEQEQRVRAAKQTMEGPPPEYQVVLDADLLLRARAHKLALARKQKQPGKYLRQVLEGNGIRLDSLSHMTDQDFLGWLMSTRQPCICAESAVAFDETDWTKEEAVLLGGMSVLMFGQAFDDGHHDVPVVFRKPADVYLGYVAGPLLQVKNQRDPIHAGASPDYGRIVNSNGEIDQDEYYNLVEQRVLPALVAISLAAQKAGKKVIIAFPGIGCGVFAGAFKGQMQKQLDTALRKLLAENHQHLTFIVALFFDGYECHDASEIEKIGHIMYVERPSRAIKLPTLGVRGLLSQVHYFALFFGFDPNDPTLVLCKFIAWDPCSFPGNDWHYGGRLTDDGVTGAATDTCRILTGQATRYESSGRGYLPPDGYPTWKAFMIAKYITMAAHNCYVCGHDRRMRQLEGNDLIELDHTSAVFPPILVSRGDDVEVGGGGGGGGGGRSGRIEQPPVDEVGGSAAGGAAQTRRASLILTGKSIPLTQEADGLETYPAIKSPSHMAPSYSSSQSEASGSVYDDGPPKQSSYSTTPWHEYIHRANTVVRSLDIGVDAARFLIVPNATNFKVVAHKYLHLSAMLNGANSVAMIPSLISITYTCYNVGAPEALAEAVVLGAQLAVVSALVAISPIGATAAFFSLGLYSLIDNVLSFYEYYGTASQSVDGLIAHRDQNKWFYEHTGLDLFQVFAQQQQQTLDALCANSEAKSYCNAHAGAVAGQTNDEFEPF